MIAKVMRGSDAAKLISYLFGPGESNVHTDQHLVASWDADPAGRQPQQVAAGRFDTGPLAKALNLPLRKLGISGGERTVWHCAVSLHSEDGQLTDDQWREVAEEIVSAAGLGEEGAQAGVRWVAVRHGTSANGNDHIHIAATLAAEDGSRRIHPRSHDFKAIGAACRELEMRMGLRHRTRPRDSSAARVRSGRAEDRRAQQAGRYTGPGESRWPMAEAVRAAVVASSDLDSLRQQLERDGILVRPVRPSDQQPGRYLGFTFADTRITEPGKDHQWISGSKLGKDLTAPKIYARWDAARQLEERWGIAETAQAAADALASSPGDADGTAWLAGELLDAWARNPQLPQQVRAVLADAARDAIRAGQPADRDLPPLDLPIHAHLRLAAVAAGARQQIKDKGARDMLAAAIQMERLAKALQAYRESQNRLHQAEDARRARRCLYQVRQAAERQHRDAAAASRTTAAPAAGRSGITPGPAAAEAASTRRGPKR